MVIEKFLALSMIALGLTTTPADGHPAGPSKPGKLRGTRRRVRWLRQQLPPRPRHDAEARRAMRRDSGA